MADNIVVISDEGRDAHVAAEAISDDEGDGTAGVDVDDRRSPAASFNTNGAAAIATTVAPAAAKAIPE